jgi:glycosyltransferase involved in cell wall biosynthesis
LLSKSAIDQGLTHLHSHSCANCAVLAMMAKCITGIPFSLTLNANIDWWGGAMSEKFQDAEFTLAITEWLLAQLRRDYPELAPNQALLGRIGVDTDAWPPKEYEAERRLPFHVVTVGRLHFSKGHDILIGAVQKLIEEGRDITLCLVGEGPQRAELEAQVQRAGSSDRISFAGSLSEDGVKEQLSRADAFALASHAEPLGVVYMEAMAAGVPTIGTAAGGVGEIITHGSDGLLVEPKNVDALARAISQLVDDPALARRLATNGRRTIVERFDSRIGAATLYTRVTGAPPPT